MDRQRNIQTDEHTGRQAGRQTGHRVWIGIAYAYSAQDEQNTSAIEQAELCSVGWYRVSSLAATYTEQREMPREKEGTTGVTMVCDWGRQQGGRVVACGAGGEQDIAGLRRISYMSLLSSMTFSP